MTLNQSARYKAYALAIAHLKENEVIIKDVPGLMQAYQEASDLLAGIADADSLRKQNKQAVMAGKKQFRDELIHHAMLIAAAIASHAAENNNQQLQTAMRFSSSELTYSRDTELGAIATNIYAQAKELSEALKKFGITDDLFKSFAAMVTEYIDAASAPRKTTAERKEAGQQIKDNLNSIRDLLKNRIDKLLLQFKFSHPEFFNQYFAKRLVVNPASRRTQVSGVVTNAATKSGLSNVQVSLQDTDLQTLTMDDGSYSLNLPTISGSVIFQKEGYRAVSIPVEGQRGLISELDVALEPVK